MGMEKTNNFFYETMLNKNYGFKRFLNNNKKICQLQFMVLL